MENYSHIAVWTLGNDGVLSYAVSEAKNTSQFKDTSKCYW